MENQQPLQRILLIDDDPSDRQLAIRTVKQEFPDIQINEAVNWADIEQALGADAFDLAITDYELNWATGLEVLKAIKASDASRPVIMFTDSGSQEIAVEAMKAGLDDYVLKSPRHLIRLSQAVRVVWENHQARQRAAELELRLEFLLDELDVGVFRTTLDGHLMDASKGLLHLLGLQSGATAEKFFRDNIASLSTEQAKQQVWHQEVQVGPTPDGSRWLQISATVTQSGNRSVIDGLISDITERKETAAALQQLNQTLEQRVHERTAQLERLNHELEAFTFSVSHELRSPIRQISGFIDLLREKLQSLSDDSTVAYYIQVIDQLAIQSGQMIDDLLALSRTGRAEMRIGPVSMDSLISDIRLQMEALLSERTVRWQIGALPAVHGDRNLLRSVWRNLIENAVKYTQKRSVASIEIGSFAGDGEQIFFVRDNGIGFSTNDTRQLFGTFQRLPNAEDFSGTGIGLAHAQRIIHRHGGRIWAEGEPDIGATFYFSLPNSLIDS